MNSKKDCVSRSTILTLRNWYVNESNRIIALLTDFGTRDYYVGAMKGVILSINPDAAIVDITHEIEPQNIMSAAFVLSACYRDFPAGTIFVSVVDPGVGSERRAIAAASNGHTFVGPDNGLFGLVLAGDAKIVSIENDEFFRKPVSSTFHGRDIFASVAAHLSSGADLEDLGPVISEPVTLPNIRSRKIGEDVLEGSVIHIDRFGNMVTNVTAQDAPSAFKLEVAGRSITERRQFYAGAEPGEPFAIAGSAGFIEVSINGGSAANELAVKIGTPVTVRLI
jgi:S-adenosylmethionine hydrolase